MRIIPYRNVTRIEIIIHMQCSKHYFVCGNLLVNNGYNEFIPWQGLIVWLLCWPLAHGSPASPFLILKLCHSSHPLFIFSFFLKSYFLLFLPVSCPFPPDNILMLTSVN